MQEPQWPSPTGPPSNNDPPMELYTEPLEDPVLDEALEELKSGALIAQQDLEADEAGEREDPTRVVRRRATYTREHKLAAIHYATKTWRTDYSGSKAIGRQEAAKTLHLSWAVLWQWMAAAADIEAMPTGSLKNRRKGRRSSVLGAAPTGVTKPTGRPSRKVSVSQDANKSNSGTLSEILASQSQVRLSNGQPPKDAPAVYPTPQQEHPPTGDAPNGTVPYDLPWTLSPASKRSVQVIFSTLDNASKASNSDVQFCAIVSSKIQDSTVRQSQIKATHISTGCNIVQSTLKSAFITACSSVTASSVENSLVSNASLTNCTVLNSQITGGDHIGKTMINAHVSGKQNSSTHRATMPERDDEVNLEESGEAGSEAG